MHQSVIGNLLFILSIWLDSPGTAQYEIIHPFDRIHRIDYLSIWPDEAVGDR